MLDPERKEGRVNINYRFPGVYIESNLATVRHTPVFCHNFGVIEWIILMRSPNTSSRDNFAVSESSSRRQVTHQKAAFFEVNTKLDNTFYLT